MFFKGHLILVKIMHKYTEDFGNLILGSGELRCVGYPRLQLMHACSCFFRHIQSKRHRG